MPQAPATRPPITTMETWLAAPMASRMTPRASAIAPTTGPGCVLVAGADGPGMGGPGGVGTGGWGAYPRGMGAAGPDPWYPGYPGPAGPRAWPACGSLHQMVSLGGTICCSAAASVRCPPCRAARTAAAGRAAKIREGASAARTG